jgi:hypothetical protein
VASSEEERQAWIRAIQVAMIGGGGEDGPRRELDLAPHQEALDLYTQLRESWPRILPEEAEARAIATSSVLRRTIKNAY